ncbi:MAG: hypothetical protein ABJE95_32865 [Byssovorax sp.]
MIPSRFERVRWDVFEQNECSPPLPPAFRGILLAAPARVIAEGRAVLPVAGAYQVSGRFLNRFTSMVNEITLVAVDAATHVPRSANLLRPDQKATPTGFRPSNPRLDQIVVGGWFNLDLYCWIKDLPRDPARYHVFATVGDVVSNVVTVEVGGS